MYCKKKCSQCNTNLVSTLEISKHFILVLIKGVESFKGVLMRSEGVNFKAIALIFTISVPFASAMEIPGPSLDIVWEVVNKTPEPIVIRHSKIDDISLKSGATSIIKVQEDVNLLGLVITDQQEDYRIHAEVIITPTTHRINDIEFNLLNFKAILTSQDPIDFAELKKLDTAYFSRGRLWDEYRIKITVKGKDLSASTIEIFYVPQQEPEQKIKIITL